MINAERRLKEAEDARKLKEAEANSIENKAADFLKGLFGPKEDVQPQKKIILQEK